MSASPRASLSLACFGHALVHGSKIALPLATLSVTAADLDVGPEQMGWAISAYTVGMALSAVPGGVVSDRRGPLPVLATCFWTLALAAMCCAVATSYALFVAAHAGLGLAAGLFHPAGLSLISLGIPARQVGRAMGTFGVAAAFGTALMPLAMGTAAGWRVGFLMLSFLGFLGAGACHWLRAGGLVAVGRQVADGGALQGSARKRGLLLLLLAMGANAFALSGFEALFPEHLSLRAAAGGGGWLTAGAADLATPGTRLAVLVLALGGLGQWVGGLLAGGRLAAARYALLILIQPLCLLLLVRNLDATLAAVLLPMAAFTFMNTATQPVENKLLASFTSTRRRSTAFALKFLVAVLVAAPAPGLVSELYAGEGGLPPAYRLVAAAAVVGLVAAVLFLRFGRGRSTEH